MAQKSNYFTNGGALTENLVPPPNQGGGGAGTTCIVVDKIVVSTRCNATTTATAHRVVLSDNTGDVFVCDYPVVLGNDTQALCGQLELTFPRGEHGGTGPRIYGTSPQLLTALTTGGAITRTHGFISYHYE